MKNQLLEMVVDPNSVTRLDENIIYKPALEYSENFHISSVLDCYSEIKGSPGW
ncbi:MAG: hypothetical protein ACI88H_002796 [Cocleimonas sp.]|jgi:hypothetical protein